MFRREFLEVIGASGLSITGVKDWTSSEESALEVEFLIALPHEPGEYMARVVDDAFETTCYWRGNVEKNPMTVSVGSINVRSDHGFVLTEAPSKSVSTSFMWIEGISKIVVDFREEKLHLVYSDTAEDKYWSAQKKSAYHRYRMQKSLKDAKAGGEVNRREKWRYARHHRQKMYQNSKTSVAAMES